MFRQSTHMPTLITQLHTTSNVKVLKKKKKKKKRAYRDTSILGE